MSYSKFDLTFKIGQYLDRHLVFPLLEFLAAKEVCPQSFFITVKYIFIYTLSPNLIMLSSYGTKHLT